MVDQNSQFYAILTNVGAAKQANADALGIAWKITQMGVGDANDTDPTPNASQISLINEWRRAPLNQLKIDDKDSSIIVAEQVIPAEVGGRWIREIGLYDADGDLVAVANCPPTYKPLLNQGSGRTQVVRMNLVVSSSSNVELKIDPSAVVATREWVTSELAKQDFKHSVLVATTANIVLAGLQTIDEVVLAAGDRVLVKNQAASKDNGLYTVAAGAWVRCSDADASAEVTPGLLVLVERGTVNGDSAWQLLTNAPITLGVTALAFDMAFGRTGVAEGTYRSVTVDKYGRVVAATNPTTVAGYGLTDVYTRAQIDQALVLKAPLASPVFTGDPRAPTAPKSNVSKSVANTEFVKEAGFVLPSARIWVPLGATLGQEHAGAHLAVGESATWSGTIYLPAVGIDIGSVFTIQISSGNGTLTLAVSNAPTGYIAVGSTQLNEVTITSKDQPLMVAYVAPGVYQVISGSPSAISRDTTPYRLKQYYRAAGVYQWTVPTNVYRVDVEVRGGGGSGAFGADGSSTIGPGGGGGGGISKRLCAVTPGSVITVTVGAGGPAVTVAETGGNAGGTSSFGAFCSATGGRGGAMNVGALSGQGAGGDYNAAMGMGFPPVRNSAGTANWGGPGGGGESAFAASDASALTQPGMGGGGRTKISSQAGVDGCVIITY